VDGILPECTTTDIGFKYYGIADNQNQAITDTGVPRYLGTLIVKVSANACGTFTIGHVQEITSTFITDPATFKPISSLPSVQPLVLTVSDCSRQLLSCSPGHCNIDARIAHDRLDEFAGRNPFQTVMTFSKTVVGVCSNSPFQACTLSSQCSPGGTCTGGLDLEVTVLPFDPDDTVPAINLITAGGDPKVANVQFQPRIQQTRWTCFRDRGSNKRCCMGSLPPDADNNRISQSDDVFELFDNLSGCLNPPTCNAPLLPIERCNIDRSTLCTGADLLMAVDVLTGADAFTETNGDQLPALTNQSCPDMRLPP